MPPIKPLHTSLLKMANKISGTAIPAIIPDAITNHIPGFSQVKKPIYGTMNAKPSPAKKDNKPLFSEIIALSTTC